MHDRHPRRLAGHLLRGLLIGSLALGTFAAPSAFASGYGYGIDKQAAYQARVDRTRGGITAPPDGLYLVAIDYPEDYKIPRLSTDCGLW